MLRSPHELTELDEMPLVVRQLRAELHVADSTLVQQLDAAATH